MKKEDLKGTKIYISSKQDRGLYIEKILKLGISISDATKTLLKFNECPFIYINEDYELHADKNSEDGKCAFLNDYESEQIFLDDVLAIKEPKGVCKSNPFDVINDIIKQYNIKK